MISGDIYNEQIARYEFSSDFVSKRVLNITNNTKAFQQIQH